MAGRLQTGPTGAEGAPPRRLPSRAQIDRVYRLLLEQHGAQQWWPHADDGEADDGDSGALEICLGAILTQNTAWRGAAAALERLLAIWGVGPETADAMLLYAARKPTFVVDAYSYWLFERLGLAPAERKYERYRRFFLRRIGRDVARLNEWHALIVRHGQRVCRRTRPLCEQCALLPHCRYGRRELGEVVAHG